MRTIKNILISAALVSMAVPAFAASTKLTVVTVDPQSLNCVFSPSCDVTPTDTMGVFPDSRGFTGPVRVQSRTFMGAARSKAAGMTAYIYRIDFTHAVRGKDMFCADSADIDFGPVAKLPYGAKGAPGDVFVINAGSMASVGVKSAELSKNDLSIEFASPVCPANGAYPGQTTFFFGMASAKAPKPDKISVFLKFGGSNVSVPARIPVH